MVKTKRLELEHRLAEFLISRSKITSEAATAFVDGKSHLFSADEALSVGLVTRILRSRPELLSLVSELPDQGKLPFNCHQNL